MSIFFRISVLIIIIRSLSGCAGFQFLEGDQKLLFKQNIQSGKEFDKYTLEDLLVQKANVKFPPYPVMYQWGLNKFDTVKYENKKIAVAEEFDQKIAEETKESKINKLENKKRNKVDKINSKLINGNNLMQWGEPLAVFDSSMVERNKQNIENYLFNHGYFLGKVNTKIKYKGRGKRKGKKVIVDYKVNAGKPYTLDTIYYRSGDSLILSLLKSPQNHSLIIKGQNYQQRALIRERERIEFFLKDNGYYEFNRQFIRYAIDTSYGKPSEHKVAVRIAINESSKGNHKQFKIDSVNFIINPGYRKDNEAEKVHKNYKDINYSFYEDIFSTKMLSKRTFIYPDSLYNRSNSIRTQRQLSNLDNFRFININYDSSGGDFIANIYTSPLDRYQWTHELGLNVTQGFPGPFYNLTLKKRNIFRGLENFEISGRFGLEGVATPGDAAGLYRNREIGVNASLIFPQFLFPASQKFKDKIGKENPRTRLLVGYTDIDRFEYRRTNINISHTYTWQNENNTYFSFALADLNIINTPKITPYFENILNSLNNRLINSFKPSLVSDIKFNFYKTQVSDNQVSATRTKYYRVQFESGGTVLNFLDPTPITDRGLEYFKYIKFDADYSRSRPISSVASVAFRVNAGMALPYSPNNALPYEKYLFAGGSNGIRAWRPRRLGPGSYTPLNSSGELSYSFEQQGELLLQGSLELRRDLFGFIESAIFIDVGNIWLLKDDDQRTGEEFRFDRFYKEFAVGTGAGLRFDFSFLIMRFDVGIKTYDPARPEKKRFIFSDSFNEFPFDNPKTSELLVFNIGVGYPF